MKDRGHVHAKEAYAFIPQKVAQTMAIVVCGKAENRERRCTNSTGSDGYWNWKGLFLQTLQLPWDFASSKFNA